MTAAESAVLGEVQGTRQKICPKIECEKVLFDATSPRHGFLTSSWPNWQVRFSGELKMNQTLGNGPLIGPRAHHNQVMAHTANDCLGAFGYRRELSLNVSEI